MSSAKKFSPEEIIAAETLICIKGTPPRSLQERCLFQPIRTGLVMLSNCRKHRNGCPHCRQLRFTNGKEFLKLKNDKCRTCWIILYKFYKGQKMTKKDIRERNEELRKEKNGIKKQCLMLF